MKRLVSLVLALVLAMGLLMGAAAEFKADYDLSVMSNVMQVSLIAQLIERPQGFTGKTVKIQCYFSSLMSRQKETRVFFGNIVDMRACCFNDGSYLFELVFDAPEETTLPAEGQECVVYGTLELDRNCNLVHVEAIELLEGHQDDIKW